MILLILIVMLVLFLSGPWYPYSREWGYGPSGVLTIILIVLLIYFLTGGRRL